MICIMNGVRYHVEVTGKGFPLVLLHGFTGDSTTWTTFSKKWCQERQVIVIDIIGHGKTDSPTDVKRYDMLSVVEDVKKILESLGISKTDMLGYSMGGRLALSFAIQYPECIRQLILESSSPGLESEKERMNRRENDEKICRFIEEQGIEKFVEYWGNIPLFSSQKKLPQQKQKEIQEQRLQNNPVGLCNSLRGMGTGSQPSWWEHLQNFQGETLLVTGSLDEKFCNIAKRMETLMTNANWITVEECGHAIHVEQPEKFGTIVKEFCRKFSKLHSFEKLDT